MMAKFDEVPLEQVPSEALAPLCRELADTVRVLDAGFQMAICTLRAAIPHIRNRDVQQEVIRLLRGTKAQYDDRPIEPISSLIGKRATLKPVIPPAVRRYLDDHH